MARQFLATVVAFALIAGYATAEACVCITIVIVESKPSTRLHNALLTESPAHWWQQHRAKIINALYDPDGQLQRKEYQAVTTSMLESVVLEDRQVEINCAEDFLEFLYCYERTAEVVLKDIEQQEELNDADYDAIQYLQACARNLRENAESSDDLESLRKQWQEITQRSFDGSGGAHVKTLHDNLTKLASDTMLRERIVLHGLYDVYPEKVVVDCLFNLVYLNQPTLAELPKDTFSIYYPRFNTRQTEEAAAESRQILLDIGKAALPYIERAYVELSGYQYKSPFCDAARNYLHKGITSDKPDFSRYPALEDQRRNGILASLSADEYDNLDNLILLRSIAAGKLQKQATLLRDQYTAKKITDKEFQHRMDVLTNSPEYNFDASKLRIKPEQQLLPIFLDFNLVFNRDYNTPFHRTDNALETLRELWREINK